MTPETTTDDAQPITIEHNDETIDVPRTFDLNDCAAFFGAVPDTFAVDRIFLLENNVRVESYLGGGEWVEVCYQTDESAPIFNASELGWVAEHIDGATPGSDYPNADETDRYPGETRWLND